MKILQLCDANYRLRIKGSGISSFKPGSFFSLNQDTEFVAQNKIFGGFVLRSPEIEAGQTVVIDTNTECDIADISAGNRQSSFLLQPKTSFSDILDINITYELKEGAVHYTVKLLNKANKPISIEDLGFQFPCHTHFAWGEPAGDKVIGHHFIAGHGSHLTFIRCDGKGPFLMLLPQKDTGFEYFDEYVVSEGQEESDEKEKVYTAYVHSAHVRQEAIEAGSKMRMPESKKVLNSGETAEYSFTYLFADDYQQVREKLVQYGMIDVEVAPGLTVPQNTEVWLSLNTAWQDLSLQLPEGTEIVTEKHNGLRHNYLLRFAEYGERQIRVCYDSNKKYMNIDFFVTQDVKTLLKKRADFLRKTQITDESQWYYGLLGEWNNETGALLSPGNYDKISGWRIYEVSCDDPGLGKPAFLSGVLAEHPEFGAVQAMDRYVENFVWGGLQCTEEEPYPYGIYGIPHWKHNRESDNADIGGKLHIWRIYDYPHIMLMYYNLYRIARNYADMPLSHDDKTYLLRAYRTAVAMFTIPLELEEWSAFKTGLYNELAIEEIIEALKRENLSFEAVRLERLWNRKVKFFVLESTDIFGSEYPFDTTGFESTHALAKRGLKFAETEEKENYHNPQITREKAWSFMENQTVCNLACRGILEPAYYWYGSDYRSNNWTYTLSYMAQMGGWSLLDYALYYAENPFALLRIAYGSVLSSWALMNAGDKEHNYGYWFPGEEHDGAASGGFEPLPLGETWLDQPHHGGPWYYSCEIDLGYCGYLRAAATIVAEDPIFGRICYGGTMQAEGNQITVVPEDGVNRRFHYVDESVRVHILLDEGTIESVAIDLAQKLCVLQADLSALQQEAVSVTVQVGETEEHYQIKTQDKETWKVAVSF